MVRGIEKFKEYFQEYANQYVLIGGTACDISFSQHSGDFFILMIMSTAYLLSC